MSESELWKNHIVPACVELRYRKHKVDLQRLENSVGVGHPDVEGCIDGEALWIELKHEDRPKRETTKIQFKTRRSQAVWHADRCDAGFRRNWVLAQVGRGHEALLYLIPGSLYERIITTEQDLSEMATTFMHLSHTADILLRAKDGWVT